MIGTRKESVSLRVDGWMSDLIDLKAKNRGVSKSEFIRTILKDSLVIAPKKRFRDSGYYNDRNGILRSRKQI